MQGELIGTAEAAALLGKSPRTVARMALDGRLQPAIRVPGYRGPLLFDRTYIETLANKAAA